MDRDFTIRFNSLPFKPEKCQVIYVENEFDEAANRFINENYEEICQLFNNYEMEFIYLPKLVFDEAMKKKLYYYAPYIPASFFDHQLPSNTLLDYMARPENRSKIQPSVLFHFEKSKGRWTFGGKVLAIDKYLLELYPALTFVSEIVVAKGKVEDSEKKTQPIKPIRLSYKRKIKEEPTICQEPSLFTDCCQNISTVEKEREEEEEKVNQILGELKDKVRELRLSGVSLMAIHNMIDQQEPLSRVVITPDYRIFLPDYNNIEIEMGALPKSVYFLFLRYPKGIIIKHLADYRGELYKIYKQLRPETDEMTLEATIAKVTDPLRNAMNENLARIRKAFVEKFDERLARNYIITGDKGSEYLIPLDRKLIEWKD